MKRHRAGGLTIDPGLHTGSAQLAAGLAGLVAAVYAAIGIVESDPDLVFRAVAPGVYALVLGGLLALRRAHAAATLAGGALVIAWQAAVASHAPPADANIPLGLIAIGVAGAVFVAKWLRAYVAGYVVLLIGVLAVTHYGPDRAMLVPRAGAVVVVFLFLVWLMLWVRRSAAAREDRYTTLFRSAPVAMFELDLREVAAWLAGLRHRGVDDLGGHLTDYPELVVHAAELIRVGAVNDAALRLLGAARTGELPPLIDILHRNEAFDSLRPLVGAIWTGAAGAEAVIDLGAAEPGVIRWSASPGPDGPDLGRVIATFDPGIPAPRLLPAG